MTKIKRIFVVQGLWKALFIELWWAFLTLAFLVGVYFGLAVGMGQ